MRATILIIVSYSVVLIVSLFSAAALAQDQAARPGASSNQEQPPASTSPPAEPPAAAQTPPGLQPENTLPKPPVLRHKKRKPAGHKSRTTKPADSGPSKVVVRNGGTKEGSTQLAPGITQAQAQHQKASTDTLLATTDANLKQTAGRQLTPAEQRMVDEIRIYVRQSKTATEAGDVTRAHTLAYKARLLSDELARK